MSKSDKRRRGRRWWWVIGGGLSLGFGVALLLGLLATSKPRWYEPVAVDYGRLPDDKRALVSLIDEVGIALNQGESYTFELDEAQLNRWLAARDELWPDLDLKLEGFGWPHVSLLDEGRIRIAVLAERGGWPVVVGISFGVAVNEDVIRIQWSDARIGSLSVPDSWVGELLRTLVRRWVEGLEAVSTEGIVLENGWVWPNGDQSFRIRGFGVGDKRVRVSLARSGSGP